MQEGFDFFSLDMLRELIPPTYIDTLLCLKTSVSDLVESGIFSEFMAPNIPLEVLVLKPFYEICFALFPIISYLFTKVCDPVASISYSFQCLLLRNICLEKQMKTAKEDILHSREKIIEMGKKKYREILEEKIHVWRSVLAQEVL